MSAAGRIVRMWLALPLLAICLPTASATPEQEVEFAARDAERFFDRSGLLVDDAEGQAYLHAILRRLVEAAPDTSLADCRVFLIRGAHANAFALPTCRVYLSTALIMALDNDAQVAAVVARELAHVQQRSVVTNRRLLDQKLNAASFFLAALVAGTGMPPVSAPGGGANMTEAVGDLVWRVSVRGFTPELEQQADRRATARLAAAGIDAADVLRSLERLRAIAPAVDSQERDTVPMLASRAVLDERIVRLRQASGRNSEGATTGSPAHAQLVSRLRLAQIRTLMDAGDGARARALLAEQVAASGESGAASYLAAELLRRAAAAPEEILAAYDRAAQYADAPARLFLEQGLLLREVGQEQRARQAFQRFLELEPAAIEAALVRHYLEQPVNPE